MAKSLLPFSLFLLFLSLLSNAFVEDWGFPESDDVIILTNSDFDEALSKFDFIMVVFYVPWCKHSQMLAPEYANAARRLRNQKNPVPLARINASSEKELAALFDVEGYPTILFFVKGNVMQYTGERTESAIVEWVNLKSRPASQEIWSQEALEKFKEQNRVGVVFYGEFNSAKLKDFQSASIGFDGIGFAHVFNETLREKESLEVNSVVLYKQFDERRVEFEGKVENEEFEKFILAHQRSAIIEINQNNAELLFGGEKDVLLLFVQNSSEAALRVLEECTGELRTKILMGFLILDDFGLKVADYLGVTSEEAPAIRILEYEPKGIKKFAPETREITKKAVLEFFDAFTLGKLQPFYKSQEIPKSNNGPVKVNPNLFSFAQ